MQSWPVSLSGDHTRACLVNCSLIYFFAIQQCELFATSLLLQSNHVLFRMFLSLLHQHHLTFTPLTLRFYILRYLIVSPLSLPNALFTLLLVIIVVLDPLCLVWLDIASL